MASFDQPLVAASTKNDGVTFVRDDLAKKFATYRLINDCLEGSETVKSKGELYLPRPDPSNKEKENLDRYDAYITRAVFYNVTQRTALGLLGEIFSRAPNVKYPKSLEQVVTDSNGGGISLEQTARNAVWFALGCGRGGLFVDYPPREGTATTRAEQTAGNIRPTITVYDAMSVINWRTITIGSRVILSLVVLKEEYTSGDDGFATETGVQYRELRLGSDGRYFVQVWRPKLAREGEEASAKDYEKFGAPYYPRDGAGNFLDEIPFTFFGSRNNEPSIDPPPLYDMADLNIAHYRNSADYEEMVYVVGQPTVVVAGLDADWYNTILNKKIPIGSRSGLPLPVGATAEILQIEESTMAFQAMEHKERQMVALGAKLVEQRETQRTATEAVLEDSSEDSTLVAIAKNVSKALQWALEWCAVFQNVPETGIVYELNTDFQLAKMSAADRAAVIKSWLDGAISWTEMRTALRKNGIASLEDAKAKAEIEADQAKAIETAAKEIAATTKATTENSPQQ
ncbi:MAG TPA: DUF4055 domain-containing protein [Gammaproteobacteria bacterium]|nr:DUF4055 domain-containing protein [Gammaproteobacteria bacterium]